MKKGGEDMKILKHLFCKHEYKCEFEFMVDGGLAKMYKLTCLKCGKTKYTTFSGFLCNRDLDRIVKTGGTNQKEGRGY